MLKGSVPVDLDVVSAMMEKNPRPDTLPCHTNPDTLPGHNDMVHSHVTIILTHYQVTVIRH